MSDLCTNLALAWRDRATKAAAMLQHSETAPALFRPEYVAELQEEVMYALGQFNFWRNQP